MKKLMALTLATAITTSIFAVDDTQKTTLILRDHRNRAMNFTTFHELKSHKEKSPSTDTLKSKFQITSFYKETQNNKKLGEVFGANGKNEIIVGTATQVAAGTADVENNFLLHYHDTLVAENTLEGTLKFNPEQRVSGSSMETYTRLDKIFRGLYYKQSVGFIDVEHSLNVDFCSEATGAESTEAHKLLAVLSGSNLTRALGGAPFDRYSEQNPLMYAKLPHPPDRRGMINSESRVGWHFLEKKSPTNLTDYYAGVHLNFQTQTGDRPTAEFLWEPRLGNKHCGFGIGMDAGATLWRSKNTSLEVMFEFNYLHHSEETEKRTLGIKNILTEDKYKKHILSHYYLLGKVGKYVLYPAANVLTKNVDVDPGGEIDSFLNLNFNFKNFSFDAGYNFYWREREKVTLNSCLWTDDTYAIADFDWQTCNSAFALTDALPASTAINFCNIDTSVAETPSITSHTMFGSFGYIFKNWKYPFMLALGAAYEWGENRNSADTFTLWIKGGLSF